MSTPETLIHYDSRVLHDIIQWDVPTWKSALFFWDRHFPDVRGRRVLDIGARDGGLSLYFALRGCRVLCSDVHGPTEKAKELHARYNVSSRVEYAALDGCNLPLSDSLFDIVTFKSMLGALGAYDNYEAQKRAVSEMFRVLRPGGSILFAENMRGSPFHNRLRKHLTTWGNRWRYLTRSEVDELFSSASELNVLYSGVLGVLGRNNSQKQLLSLVDTLVRPITPRSCRYMVYGYASK